jgi:uncharacterized membrane protein YfcA
MEDHASTSPAMQSCPLRRAQRARFVHARRRSEASASTQAVKTHHMWVDIALAAAGIGLAGAGFALTGHAGWIGPMFALLCAACFSSGAGFAFSPVSQALLTPFAFDGVQIVQMLLVCSIGTQALTIVSLRQGIAWRHLPPYLAGGVLGLPIGILLLLHLAVSGFRVAIGLTILIYGIVVLIRRPIVLPPTGWWANVAIGFIGGVTGGLAAFPGAAVTIWVGMQGWDKMRQRGIYQPFILTMQVLALPMLSLMRTASGKSVGHSFAGLVVALPFLPGALIGAWLGLRVFRRISDRRFEQCTAGLLALAGLMMIL